MRPNGIAVLSPYSFSESRSFSSSVSLSSSSLISSVNFADSSASGSSDARTDSFFSANSESAMLDPYTRYIDHLQPGFGLGQHYFCFGIDRFDLFDVLIQFLQKGCSTFCLVQYLSLFWRFCIKSNSRFDERTIRLAVSREAESFPVRICQ